MKIERINENQIRCTLNKSDLADRGLRLTELAYGTDKAKKLFRDMMRQASYELGFEAEDIPLMIEAIPVSPDCLILVMTKVEDPEELDTRFSKFSKPISLSLDEDSEEEDLEDENTEDPMDYEDEPTEDTIVYEDSEEEPQDPEAIQKAESILDLLNDLDAELGDLDDGNSTSSNTEENLANINRVFAFTNLDHVIHAARAFAPLYHQKNVLYQNPADGNYYLVLSSENMQPPVFRYLCDVMTEYAPHKQGNYASLNYMEEHFKKLLEPSAIQKLMGL